MNARNINSPGLYYFKPNLFSLRALGFRGNASFNDDDFELAQKIFIKNIKKTINIYSDREWIARLSEPFKSDANSLEFAVTAKPIIPDDLIETINSFKGFNVDEHNLPLINSFIDFLPPIYVGIAKEQCISERYEQHERNFKNRRKGTFGYRVSKYIDDWAYLEFYGIEFIPNRERSDLEIIEKLIHKIIKPVYCVR